MSLLVPKALLTVLFSLCAASLAGAVEPPYDPALLHPFNPPGLWRGEGIGLIGGRMINSSMDILNVKTDSSSVGDYSSFRGGLRYGVRDSFEFFGDIERADLDISRTFGSVGITTVTSGGRWVGRSYQNDLVGSWDFGYRTHLGDEFTSDRLTINNTDITATVTAPPGGHLISGNTSDWELYTRGILGKSLFKDTFTMYGLLGFHYVKDRSSFNFQNLNFALSASDRALFGRVQQNLGRTEQHYEAGLGANWHPLDRLALNVSYKYYYIQRQWPVAAFSGQLNRNQQIDGNVDIRLTKAIHLLFEATYFQYGLLTEIPSLYNERTQSRFAQNYGYLGLSLRMFFFTGL